MPTAFVENRNVYNSGFWFKPQSRQQFFKTGLTDSEKAFFKIPEAKTPKIFASNGIRFGILICFEAEHGCWEYFDADDVDVILWPGYWGWTLDSGWSHEKQPGELNLIYQNQKTWKRPLIQANFAFNDLDRASGAGPEGLSVVIDSKNNLRHRGAHSKASGFIVNLTNDGSSIDVLSIESLDD